ncbi:MAG TPA: hypothetical protein VK203_07755 [Nostocaceae cyanobacterium]|nr:hypothetical protein [Nostocaceae cyanobacterium]
MAQKNNLLSVLLSSTPNFLSQLIFGVMITIIASMLGASLILSIFLGVVGGFTLGWFTTPDDTSPPPVVPSNDGIDAGLKYWLFFIMGFTLLGYSAPISIFLGAIGAIGGGWVIAWWRSKEDTKTQLPEELMAEGETEETEVRSNRKFRRKPTRRFRRGSESSRSFTFLQFWKK